MNKNRKIKVLVVEDGGAEHVSLLNILSADPAIQVVGTARSGRGALQFLAGKSADAILLDIDLRASDGFEATRQIMETRALPIIVCNGSNEPKSASAAFRALEAGAVACVERPPARDHKEFHKRTAHLLQTVKLMSEVKVVHRWPRRRCAIANDPDAALAEMPRTGRIAMIGIGASTGGPPVLQAIFSALPKDFPIPLLVVQHIAPGFLAGLADWLNQTTGLKVHIAGHQMTPLPGHAYLAPDGMHMTIDSDGQISLNRDQPENGLRPSVAQLFRSLAQQAGPRAAGVLLTGMGKDGAQELKLMRDRGALTIAQDQETSVVHGMPGEAIALGAVQYVLGTSQIAPALISLTHQPTIAEENRS